MTLSPAPAAVAAVAACSCCAYAVWKLHAERSRFASERQRLEAQAAKALRLRAEERAGRTTAERRLRQQLQQSEAARRDRGGGDVGSTTSTSTSTSTSRVKDGRDNGDERAGNGGSGGSSSVVVYRPIGYLESCFVERRGTPRQGMLAPAARSRLRILPTVVQAAALEGIEGFSHVWLIWDFHENTNSTAVVDAGVGKGGRRGGRGGGSSGENSGAGAGAGASGRLRQVKAKIHPPGLQGKKVGLFATRTPHRPNPIGLSLCRLVRVEGSGDGRDTLVLGGADIVDGTPILDVKPYLGHDRIGRPLAPSSSEAPLPSSSSSSETSSETSSEAPSSSSTGGGLRVPEWCASREDASLIREVRFDDAAEMGLRQALLLEDGTAGSGASAGGSTTGAATAGAGGMRFYRGAEELMELREAIRQALLLDIRSVHQGRGRHGQGQRYAMRFDALEITFQTFETHVLVATCKLMAPASSNMTSACLS